MGLFDFLRNKKDTKEDESTSVNPQVTLSDEVKSFLSFARSLNNPEKGLSFLSDDDAYTSADSYNQIEAFQSLSLIPLEDSNNSNPLCYVSYGCASGMIMQLSHSDDSRILFDSLESFKSALKKNISDLDWFEDFIEGLPTLKDDKDFNQTVLQLLNAPITDESEFLICMYMKSVKHFDEQIVHKCIESDEMYIQESLFNEIADRSQVELLPILEAPREFHPQVDNAYKNMIVKLKAL